MEAPQRTRARTTRRITVGYILAETFSAWFRNLIPFVVITALVFLPVVLYGWYEGQKLAEVDPAEDEGSAYEVVLDLGSSLLTSVLAGAFTFGVVRKLQGRPAGLGACISVGFSRLPAVLGVSLLVGLIIAVVTLPSMLLPGSLGGLLRIPALWLNCLMIVAVPAAVIERPGLLGALQRSEVLTRGRRWTIFGSLFCFGVLAFVAQKVAEMVFIPRLDDVTEARIAAFAYTSLGLVVLFGSLLAVSASVIYHGLRLDKEGTSADDLAKVFE